MLGRWLLCSLLLVSAAAEAAPAQIAVLPWTAAEKDLEPYGRPLARLLARRLAAATKLRVAALTDLDKMPKRVALVVDGRAMADGERVRLEARVRDPARGETLKVVTTRTVALSELETLAVDLVAQLAPVLPMLIEGAKRTRAPPKAVRPSQPLSPTNRGRAMLIPPVSGSAGLYAATRATPTVMNLARRLGFEPVPIAEVGALDPAIIRARMEQYGARWALVLHIDRIRFAPKRVLTAKGVGQFILYDHTGEVVFDRRFATDTVVGSRGDTEAALIRFVTGQLTSMAEPILRKRIQ